MAAIAKQIEDFLATSAPFDSLDDAQRSDLIKRAELIYLTADNALELGQQSPKLYLIQSGQFSVEDGQGPTRHLSEGDYFGYHSLIDNVSYPLEVEVDSPGLVYSFNEAAFKNVLEMPDIANFFQSTKSEALQNQGIALKPFHGRGRQSAQV